MRFELSILTLAMIAVLSGRPTLANSPEDEKALALQHVAVSSSHSPGVGQKPSALRFVQTGYASWYGRLFNRRRTANGSIYDQQRLTAAHRTLPLGTQIRVTNLRNGRSVIVRVSDRGPFAQGRIVDLSREAASEIGMLTYGVSRVRLETLLPRQSPGRPAAVAKNNPTPYEKRLSIRTGTKLAESANYC